jgi:UDP-glucose 4-epimerase
MTDLHYYAQENIDDKDKCTEVCEKTISTSHLADAILKTALDFYKVQAEQGIMPLQGEDFKVVILRPPMIYGKGCKGNYSTLTKLAKKLPLFPYVENQRSMLYIENLVEFVRLVVDNEEQGIFWPQNNEYTNTSEMVRMIAQVHDKRVIMVKGLNWALKLSSRMTGLVNKAFGSLCYDHEMSRYKQDYCLKNLAESIQETEEI